MCVAGFELGTQSSLAQNLTKVLFNTSNSVLAQKSNNDYRTQVALYNAKQAQNEAHRQQQIGIEKARVQKIEGIYQANNVLAKQSASNLDGTSFNSNLAYQDILDNSNMQSKVVKNEYFSKANDYFKQANSYLNQLNYNQKQYNKNLVYTGLTGLGQTYQVASDWYQEQKEEKA